MFNLRKRRNDRIGESAISNPLYAAYITSFVRAVVGEIMNGIPDDKMVFSVTTDGFITNATVEEMEIAKSGAISQKFAEARLALTGDPEVLSEKHRVRQILGWRTRGQATMKPGRTSTANALFSRRLELRRRSRPRSLLSRTTTSSSYSLSAAQTIRSN